MVPKQEMLWEIYKILQIGSIIARGVQLYKFEVDWMSSFQDMTY